jgi:hypothetical protein
MAIFRKCLWILAAGILADPVARADEELGSDAYIIALFPFPEAMLGVTHFQPNTPFGSGSKISPQQLPCPGGTVLAATPGQETKMYHVDAIVRYNSLKVPGDRAGSPPNGNGDRPGILTANANVCKQPQRQGTRLPDGSMRCVFAKVGRYVMLSDLFYCTNGQDLAFYRGYWEGADMLDVFSSENPMRTSENEHGLTTALGRGDTNHQNPGDKFRTFDAGPTFPVDKARFLFFTEATTEDILRIDAAISSQTGPNGAYLQCKDGTFAARTAGGCPK